MDISQLVTQKYIPTRDLIVKLIGHPLHMPDAMVEEMRTLIEDQARSWGGFNTALDYQLDTYTQAITYKNMSGPFFTVEEMERKTVSKLCNRFTLQFVRGRLAKDLANDGLIVIAIEPDKTRTEAVDAWIINGAYIQTTPEVVSEKNQLGSSLGSDETTSYAITLMGDIYHGEDIFRGRSVLDLGQQYLRG